MDKFFSQKYCDRCGGDLSSGRTMSMFNTDCICMECKAKEQKLPEYKAATDAERKVWKFQRGRIPEKTIKIY